MSSPQTHSHPSQPLISCSEANCFCKICNGPVRCKHLWHQAQARQACKGSMHDFHKLFGAEQLGCAACYCCIAKFSPWDVVNGFKYCLCSRDQLGSNRTWYSLPPAATSRAVVVVGSCRRTSFATTPFTLLLSNPRSGSRYSKLTPDEVHNRIRLLPSQHSLRACSLSPSGLV